MQKLNNIFETISESILKDFSKVIFFCEVEQKAYEIYYYAFDKTGEYKQCYELVDSDLVDSTILERMFEKMARFIRESDEFDSEKRDVITIKIEGTSENVAIEYFDKSVGLYKLKKEWKANNL